MPLCACIFTTVYMYLYHCAYVSLPLYTVRRSTTRSLGRCCGETQRCWHRSSRTCKGCVGLSARAALTPRVCLLDSVIVGCVLCVQEGDTTGGRAGEPAIGCVAHTPYNPHTNMMYNPHTHMPSGRSTPSRARTKPCEAIGAYPGGPRVVRASTRLPHRCNAARLCAACGAEGGTSMDSERVQYVSPPPFKWRQHHRLSTNMQLKHTQSITPHTRNSLKIMPPLQHPQPLPQHPWPPLTPNSRT